jgi:hypothetical protein
MGLWPTQGDEKRLCPATTFHGSATLTFVISTEAKRSGEISVLTPFRGNVFRPERSVVPEICGLLPLPQFLQQKCIVQGDLFQVVIPPRGPAVSCAHIGLEQQQPIVRFQRS